MINTIRGLEGFSFSMFYRSEGWMRVFFFRGCEHIYIFSGLEEEVLSRLFQEIVLSLLISDQL